MQIEEIVKAFEKKQYMLDMGAVKLSQWLKCTPEQIRAAKVIFRNKLHIETGKNYPKILVFDVECSPSISYTWRRFKENVSLDQVIQDPILLTWSAKWLFGLDMFRDKITPDEVLNFDDKRITESLWKLVDEADIVIAHHGDAFDIPLLNARAVINGLKPFSAVKSIDTRKIAAQQFRFPSNKLDALATYFGISNKVKTEFELWKRCLHGEQKAINEMSFYNDHDVEILEEVYLKLRPYIKSHPNIAMYIEAKKPVCSCCGSSNLIEESKFYYTNTAKYEQYRCLECGGLTRGRINLLTKEDKKNLLTAIPR